MQTSQDWALFIRDDGSTDNTLDIARGYHERNPERIHIVPHDGTRLNAAGNFAALLNAAQGDYVMCCDQDDVWKPDKVADTLVRMKQLEQHYGTDCPLLVHTDAVVSNRQLLPIADSFAQHYKTQPEHTAFSRLLVQNPVPGCTLMANRALMQLATPIPPAARMHDMWLALVASAFGHIGYLPERTLFYRRHGNNVIHTYPRTLDNMISEIKRIMQANWDQAEAFYAHFNERLTPEHRIVLEAFIAARRQMWGRRQITLLQHELLRVPMWQNIPVLIWM